MINLSENLNVLVIVVGSRDAFKKSKIQVDSDIEGIFKSNLHLSWKPFVSRARSVLRKLLEEKVQYENQ